MAGNICKQQLLHTHSKPIYVGDVGNQADENGTPIATAADVYVKETSFGVKHLQLLHVGVEPLLSLHDCEQLALLSERCIIRHHRASLTHAAATVARGAPVIGPDSVQHTNTKARTHASTVSWILVMH